MGFVDRSILEPGETQIVDLASSHRMTDGSNGNIYP